MRRNVSAVRGDRVNCLDGNLRLARMPARWGEFETGKLERRCHGASGQSPTALGTGAPPSTDRDRDVGFGALIKAQAPFRDCLAVRRELEPQPIARMEVPDFHRIDPVPGRDLAGFQKVVSRSPRRGRRPVPVPGTSRGNGRLWGAAPVRTGR